MIKVIIHSILKYEYITFTERTKQVVQNIKIRNLLASIPLSMLIKSQTISEYFLAQRMELQKIYHILIPNKTFFLSGILDKANFIF